jgi:hypothetical protein
MFGALKDSVDPAAFGRELGRATSAAPSGFAQITGELDLGTNTWPKSTVQLPGATNCSVEAVARSFYRCDFAQGTSADDMFPDYEYLVGLVRGATAIPPVPGVTGFITPHSVQFTLPGGGYIVVAIKGLKRAKARFPGDKSPQEFALRLEVHSLEVHLNSGAPQPQGTNSSLPIQLHHSSTVGASPVLTITNASDFSWRISFDGAQTLAVSLMPHSSQTVTLVPGKYFISGSTPAQNVIAFAPGNYTFPQDVTGTFTITVR